MLLKGQHFYHTFSQFYLYYYILYLFIVLILSYLLHTPILCTCFIHTWVACIHMCAYICFRFCFILHPFTSWKAQKCAKWAQMGQQPVVLLMDFYRWNFPTDLLRQLPQEVKTCWACAWSYTWTIYLKKTSTCRSFRPERHPTTAKLQITNKDRGDIHKRHQDLDCECTWNTEELFWADRLGFFFF